MNSSIFTKLSLLYRIKSKLAFTLAEVLITLTVIGVLAALSIPALINQINNQQYVGGLKTFYASFNGALQKYMTDKGCIGNLACTGPTGFVPSAAVSQDRPLQLITELAPYLNITKLTGYKNGGCSSKCTVDNYLNLNGSPAQNNYFNNGCNSASVVLANGAIFYFGSVPNGTNCTAQLFFNDTNEKSCGGIGVDVNGPAPPNQSGRDVFEFVIANSGYLYPFGGQKVNGYWRDGGDSNFRCNSATTDTLGRGCAARIIEEGWQMNY